MTDQQKAAMQAALEVLERLHGGCTDSDDGTVEAITVWCPEVIDALRAELAQQEREPMKLTVEVHGHGGAGNVGAHSTDPHPQQEQTKPAAWIDGSGHPRHISYVQSATERRLYGPLRPLYEVAPKQEQGEPVATLHDDGCFTWKNDEFRRKYDRHRAGWRMDVYASPPPRKPLTDEQIDRIAGYGKIKATDNVHRTFARAIERAHGIGGEHG
jgi:hypothetical protein